MGRGVDKGDKFKTNQGCVAEILEYMGSGFVLIKFIDSHSFEKVVKLDKLKKGKVRNPYHPAVCGVGFEGSGDFSVTVNGIRTRTYATWAGMISRCYRTDNPKYSTYEDCSVCEEWHNYQNFAAWLVNQVGWSSNEDWNLDKDIILEGNRLYSPETCAWVPRKINNILPSARKKLSSHPVGVWKSKTSGKFHAYCTNYAGERVFLGSFDREDDALKVRVDYKNSVLRDAAMRWKGKIDDKVYIKLLKGITHFEGGFDNA